MVLSLCIHRNIWVVNSRAYYPQTQGAVKQANKVCKARLRVVQSTASGTINKCDWARYLPLIQRVINKTRPESLPTGITPYKA